MQGLDDPASIKPDNADKIWLFFNYYALESILEKVSFSSVMPIIANSVSRHNPLHYRRKQMFIRPEQQMEVVGHQCPCVESCTTG